MKTTTSDLDLTISILRDQRLTFATKAILLYFAGHLPETIKMSVGDLTATLGISHATAYASAKSLYDFGILTREVFAHPTSIIKSSIRFSLVPDFLNKLQPDKTIDIDGGDVDDLQLASALPTATHDERYHPYPHDIDVTAPLSLDPDCPF